MKIKSMVAIATTAIVSVSLTSCGDAGGEGEGGGEIAIITVDPANPYWAAEVNRAEELAEELGYEYSVGAHENDPDEQTRLMETAINNDVDGILLDPAGADESIAIVEQAVDADIPVSLVNAEISETGLAEAQFISDNAQGASAGAEIWAEAMGYEGTYVELLGEPSDNNAQVRSEGYASVLSQYPDMEKVGEEIANWDRQEGQTAMEQLLSRNPDIDGVISGNDEMALGAINALEEAGRLDEVEVLGFDGSNDAAEAVADGKLVASVLQPIDDATTQSLEVLDEVIRTGESPVEEEKVALDCTLITEENAENLQDFVLED
ncbi:D-ribose ABC transporter substrate-binding protein [Nocardiopsis kunsanensis]|uniref:D-ribose ABC transporter substrate-binding protein n=1 Tax=Nocardiopsis kunsanensis TaxID=141693 RepID=A0A918X807_9ACTN|nr:D-ribose ABC transporter substrate-binding protein [Nocardiopsis kunsanensis]GHD16923.1 D-ribose ABC transporter substrate-binding protein [Nocardiopsis kunsanensis]